MLKSTNFVQAHYKVTQFLHQQLDMLGVGADAIAQWLSQHLYLKPCPTGFSSNTSRFPLVFMSLKTPVLSAAYISDVIHMQHKF